MDEPTEEQLRRIRLVQQATTGILTWTPYDYWRHDHAVHHATTGDLDRRSGDEILDLLAALNEQQGKTIVMVTHDPRAAARAHRILHLDKGQLVDAGA